jgi:hypothetical protein
MRRRRLSCASTKGGFQRRVETLNDSASLIGSEGKHSVYLKHAHALNQNNERDDANNEEHGHHDCARKWNFAEPARSTQANAAMAYRKVAVNTPIEWDIPGLRAIQRTKRGE